MVRKLFKHECIAYGRVMLPVYAIITAFAILGRVIQIFEADTTAYQIVNGFAIAGFVIGCLFMLGFGLVFGVVRFYRNLFTGEGYLSFTLPVTPSQHLLVKVCTAVLFQTLSVLVILLSVSIYTAGDVAVEIGNAIGYVYAQAFDVTGVHLPLFVVEILLLMIATSFVEYGTYYLCIAIGQLANKNRVIAAVGVYFAFSVVGQVLGTIFSIVFAATEQYIPWDTFGQWVIENTYTFVHSVLCGMTVLTLAIAALYLGITRFIIRRKLNLE